MLDLIRRFIGQAPAQEQKSGIHYSQLSPQGRRAPSYDSRLIDSLKQDHADLVDLFGQIGQRVDSHRYHEIPQMLVAFKTRLESHLIAENVRFYNYVEISLTGDDEDFNLMRSFRREMNVIARGVVDWVKKYQLRGVDDGNRAVFMSDYRNIGALLNQRIEREEHSLYPLYQPI